ncbi:hypothetical protein [Caldimonas brevitalea]|uniref:Uncharacterized protein n=1 Tax=Caldimonas brevitalea TaxID=413882 RepID=A0A0G3BRT4_9BURK|nr:hypothetical protein [Caldimonas brevitalea]AKJ32139.1 hypothetical protein AAW51_5448 [Caldimonas brevitalea]
MPVLRGFVERLEVGRAGRAVAAVLHDDGTRADYRLSDLAVNSVRAGEAAAQLALLRDALSRAEPIEIDYAQEAPQGPRDLERVTRITRDALLSSESTEAVPVHVVGVALFAHNQAGATAELSDTAAVTVLDAEGHVRQYLLELQIPERCVGQALLDQLCTAQHRGTPVVLHVAARELRIVGLEVGGAEATADVGSSTEVLDGFVEHIVCAPGLTAIGNSALVGFTTAPAFSGVGHTAALQSFTPRLRRFLVVTGSQEYGLFVAALRDKLRMRVLAGSVVQPADAAPRAQTAADAVEESLPTADHADGPVRMVCAAQLLAPLASMSRPVWLQVCRQSLDDGPEPAQCHDGLPADDAEVSTTAPTTAPRTAQWTGLACFNPGVYRFQFELPVTFEVNVDGRPLRLHPGDRGGLHFAHARLDGEHEVRVQLHQWTSQHRFRLDVYRIR